MNLQLLINNASAFKKSAERSLGQRPLNESHVESFIVPAIVSLAFSIELYLKFLLAKNEISERSHDLSELFDKLDLITQQKIINSTGYDKNKFKLLLYKHAETFIEWRYLHEVETDIEVNLDFMQKLASSIESIVLLLLNNSQTKA